MKQKIITIILTIIVSIVPIVIVPKICNYPSYILKYIILIFLGLLLLIMLLVNYKTLTIDKKDFLLLIFLGLVILSTFFSRDIRKSIIGEGNRYEGLIMFCIYGVIYLSSKKYFKYKNIKLFFNIMFWSSMLLGILGIVQRNVIVMNLEPLFNRGICSGFGNSNFFGSYISIILPISLFTFIIYGKKRGYLLAIIMFFNMIASGTRSAWVAFFIVSLLWGVYLIKQKNKKYFIRSIVIFISFVLIFIYLYNGCNILKINQKNNKYMGNQINSIAETKINQLKNDLEKIKNNEKINTVGSHRIVIWEMTLKVIKKYMILGCGPDNLTRGLVYACPEDIINFVDTTKTYPDKAHNEYLQIAATIGVPSLIIYLTFIGLIIIPRIKIIFKNNIYFILVVTVLSYLVQAFFNISTIGVAPIFWMILGLCDNEQTKEIT